jgi:hypothetical protein
VVQGYADPPKDFERLLTHAGQTRFRGALMSARMRLTILSNTDIGNYFETGHVRTCRDGFEVSPYSR